VMAFDHDEDGELQTVFEARQHPTEALEGVAR
jgi:hypothetical protein